jgi:hypothetical protein
MTMPTVFVKSPASAKPKGIPPAALEAGFGPPAKNGQATTKVEIRLSAYLKWEAAGKPAGDGVKFWLEAEKELSSRK